MHDQAVTWPMQPIVGSAAAIPLRSSSVPLIVTSPPYNVAIDYPSGYHDHIPWPLYVQRARKWAAEFARVLMPSGRIWLNVQPTVPKKLGDGGERVDLLGLWQEALLEAGFIHRDVVVWIQDSFDGACQWGSWLKPSSPNLRGSWEAVIVMYRPPSWKREPRAVWKKWSGEREALGGDWTDLARNVWKINPAPQTRKKKSEEGYYPAAFPIEVPARAIRLSTWPHEVVLDPFAGGGTTGRAAELLERRSVMLDLAF